MGLKPGIHVIHIRGLLIVRQEKPGDELAGRLFSIEVAVSQGRTVECAAPHNPWWYTGWGCRTRLLALMKTRKGDVVWDRMLWKRREERSDDKSDGKRRTGG